MKIFSKIELATTKLRQAIITCATKFDKIKINTKRLSVISCLFLHNLIQFYAFPPNEYPVFEISKI